MYLRFTSAVPFVHALFSSDEVLQEHHSTCHIEEIPTQFGQCNSLPQPDHSQFSIGPKDAHRLTTTDAIDTIKVPSLSETFGDPDNLQQHQEETLLNGHNSCQLKLDSSDVIDSTHNSSKKLSKETQQETTETNCETIESKHEQILTSALEDRLIGLSQKPDRSSHSHNVSQPGHINSSFFATLSRTLLSVGRFCRDLVSVTVSWQKIETVCILGSFCQGQGTRPRNDLPRQRGNEYYFHGYR